MLQKIKNIIIWTRFVLPLYMYKIYMKIFTSSAYRNHDISQMNLTRIPIQFDKICGNFWCYSNKLTTLKGSPVIIRGYFNCDSNKLTTLEGGPTQVCKYYSCTCNQLTNLIGAPEICTHDFYCNNNNLTSLKGCPKIIYGNLYCLCNPDLKYLWGIGRVLGEEFYDAHNEINEWIITCSSKGIIFPYDTLEENVNWIKSTGQYSILFRAPNEIRQMFSTYELLYIDTLC